MFGRRGIFLICHTSCLEDRTLDTQKNRRKICEYFIVAETQNPVTEFKEPPFALTIVLFLLFMDRSIKLDNQTLSHTKKICNVRPDRCLATEFEAEELSVSKSIPQNRFRLGHISPECPCIKNFLLSCSRHLLLSIHRKQHTFYKPEDEKNLSLLPPTMN